jgi:hypothetical protein
MIDECLDFRFQGCREEVVFQQAAPVAGIAALGLLQPQDLSDPAGSMMWSCC